MFEHDDIRFCADGAINLKRSPMLVPSRFHGVLFNFDDIQAPQACMAWQVFTPKRLELFRALQEQSDSITALAGRVNRDRASVNRDLSVLEKAGVVSVKERLHPGHGVIKEARVLAESITLSVVR